VQPSGPNALGTAIFRFGVLFASLFVVSLPFPYHVIPDIGGLLRPCSEALVRWSGAHLFGITRPYTSAIVSDSTGMYIHALDVALVAAALCALWSALDGRRGDDRAVRNAFNTGASLYLSLQLLIYGLDKLFKHQFGLPEPNTLYTPVGALARDILYWSAIGSSRSYNAIAGIFEIIPAILLPFRRTRPVGALWALAVVAHIVVLNFTFDISVKLYSLFLLLLCVIVAAPSLRALYDLFLRGRAVAAFGPGPRPASARMLAVHAAARAVILMAIVVEALFPYVAADSFNDDSAPRPRLHGAYDVTAFVRNGDTLPPVLGDPFRLRRFFIHRRGYFITQSMSDSMSDYTCVDDAASGRLLLNTGRANATVLAYSLSDRDSTIELRGGMGGDSVAIRARRLDLARLPLMRPSFHWTIDDYREPEAPGLP
jgi:hypothetical protein